MPVPTIAELIAEIEALAAQPRVEIREVRLDLGARELGDLRRDGAHAFRHRDETQLGIRGGAQPFKLLCRPMFGLFEDAVDHRGEERLSPAWRVSILGWLIIIIAALIAAYAFPL